MKKIALLPLAIFLLNFVAVSSYAATQYAGKPGNSNSNSINIARFAQVAPGIYRSARPSMSDLDDLKRAGFKTIINIENNQIAIDKEEKKAKALGIEFILSQMSWTEPPSDSQIDAILAAMRDPTKQPLLVHCFHGEDRTGMIVGLYRVEVQGYPPAQAYQEMIDKGFHTSITALDEYFKKRTGLK